MHQGDWLDELGIRSVKGIPNFFVLYLLQESQSSLT